MIWNPAEGIKIGAFTLHFYSLMWVVAFVLGLYIMKPIMKRENQTEDMLDKLFIWVFFGTVLGARLGHVIFYQPELFKEDFWSIFLPIRTQPEFEFTGFQGLASHGAAIAIILTMIYYSKKIIKKPLVWVLDRIVIPISCGAIFVRLGNFFNSEIYGHVTSKSSVLATKFIHEEEFWLSHNPHTITGKAGKSYDLIREIGNDPKYASLIEQIPYRYPAQLYEAIGYVFVFLPLFYMYWKTEARNKQGLLFGTFLVLLWSVRFFAEMVKESQKGVLERELGIFSDGQWLSIPFIIAGIFLIVKALTKKTTA